MKSKLESIEINIDTNFPSNRQEEISSQALLNTLSAWIFYWRKKSKKNRLNYNVKFNKLGNK